MNGSRHPTSSKLCTLDGLHIKYYKMKYNYFIIPVRYYPIDSYVAIMQPAMQLRTYTDTYISHIVAIVAFFLMPSSMTRSISFFAESLAILLSGTSSS